jgi:integration host factor subunit beta
MSTTTKKDLIDRIAESNRVKSTLVKAIVQNFLDEITIELTKGNRLEFRDFGVFEVKERAARKAQNPKTLEPIDVPASRSVKFKMGRIMKKKLNTRIAKK